MTCRDEILEVVAGLVEHQPDRVFTVRDVVEGMLARGTTYTMNTIKQHVSSRMCRNATRDPHHQYVDFERVAVNTYRLVEPVATPPQRRGQRRRRSSE